MSEAKEDKSDNQQKKAIANIYAQPQPKFASSIIASSEALKALRKAMDDAIEKGEDKCILHTGDMEPYEALVIRNDEPVEKRYWQRLKLPYTAYELPVESTRKYGPTEYYDFGIRNTEDLERDITPEDSPYFITREEQMRITLECIEQGKKYHFPPKKSKNDYK